MHASVARSRAGRMLTFGLVAWRVVSLEVVEPIRGIPTSFECAYLFSCRLLLEATVKAAVKIVSHGFIDFIKLVLLSPPLTFNNNDICVGYLCTFVNVKVRDSQTYKYLHLHQIHTNILPLTNNRTHFKTEIVPKNL